MLIVVVTEVYLNIIVIVSAVLPFAVGKLRLVAACVCKKCESVRFEFQRVLSLF